LQILIELENGACDIVAYDDGNNTVKLMTIDWDAIDRSPTLPLYLVREVTPVDKAAFELVMQEASGKHNSKYGANTLTKQQCVRLLRGVVKANLTSAQLAHIAEYMGISRSELQDKLDIVSRLGAAAVTNA
jgi:predicted butyrate kinase (DUF1464 family)